MSGRQLPAGGRRAIANDPRLRGMVMGELAAVFDPSVPFSGRPNAQYGAAEFHSIMMGAAALGTSVYGYAAAARRWKTASRGACQGAPQGPVGGVDVRHLPADRPGGPSEGVSGEGGVPRREDAGHGPDAREDRRHSNRHAPDAPLAQGARGRPCALKEQGEGGPLRQVRHGPVRRARRAAGPGRDA